MPVPTAPVVDGADRILTPSAIAFIEYLTRRFRPRIDELLERRRATQARFNAGARPDFLAETAAVRSGDWKVGAIPADLQDRRVEITGSSIEDGHQRVKNSGANVFHGGFQDATSPTWANSRRPEGPADAIRRTTMRQSDAGKRCLSRRSRR
jgi:malate synthase